MGVDAVGVLEGDGDPAVCLLAILGWASVQASAERVKGRRRARPDSDDDDGRSPLSALPTRRAAAGPLTRWTRRLGHLAPRLAFKTADWTCASCSREQSTSELVLPHPGAVARTSFADTLTKQSHQQPTRQTRTRQSSAPSAPSVSPAHT